MEESILINNFFGMSLENQIKFIDIINNDIDIEGEILHDFNGIFRNYYKEINYLVFYNEEYSKLNETLKRYLKYETLNKFYSSVLEHCDYNSDKYVKDDFINHTEALIQWIKARYNYFEQVYGDWQNFELLV